MIIWRADANISGLTVINHPHTSNLFLTNHIFNFVFFSLNEGTILKIVIYTLENRFG